MNIGLPRRETLMNIINMNIMNIGLPGRETFSLGSTHTNCQPLHLGITQIAIGPPPRTQPGTLGHFFRAIFYHSAGLYASENGKCPKPSGQAFRPPQKQGYAHLNLDNSSLNKCPKPSGQAFRPTHPNGQCPNVGGVNAKGSSLTEGLTGVLG